VTWKRWWSKTFRRHRSDNWNSLVIVGLVTKNFLSLQGWWLKFFDHCRVADQFFFCCHKIGDQNLFSVTNYNGGNQNVNILFLASQQMLRWCATQKGCVTSILTTLVVGHGVRHVQRRYEGGIQEIQVGWEHALTPIEGIPSNISKFPLITLSI
jgi:hypothetical protein